jgi:hypothetical protein
LSDTPESHDFGYRIRIESVNHQDIAIFIWQVADLLRGPYRPPRYERVMLPMTVLRRFSPTVRLNPPTRC